MNNQDGQVLTSDIVQELILELFTGQTVQKQTIIETVGEVHIKGGGRLSNTGADALVTRALSNMKRSGLTENPKRGIWFIKPHQIKTLDDFTKWTKKFAPGECVFRGVTNESYGIQASAYRRLKEDERNFEKFLEINKDLIDEVILRGYDEKEGRKLSHLEILAELQHFGAATCLIDFSHSAQVALWFACQLGSKSSQDSGNLLNGKVLAVNYHLRHFKKVKSDTLENKIDEFLQGGEDSYLYYWQPRQQNNRIIGQKSVFLFGHYEFDAYGECIILENNKQDILTELEQVSGITEAMLFPDFAKLADLRSEDVPYVGLNKYEYWQLASDQFQKENYAESVTYYDRVLDQDPDYVEAYYKRGQAKYYSEQYKSAISDLDKFISMNPDYSTDFDYIQAYNYRGLSNHCLGDLDKAVADYKTGMSLASKSRELDLLHSFGLSLDEVYDELMTKESQNE